MAPGLTLDLVRIASGSSSTVGILYIDGRLVGFTIEDEYRFEKIKGETRVPAGEYPILLRKAGEMLAKYQIKFKGIMDHPGMLELQSVPGFEFVYIHFGNYEKETDGCILVNHGATLDPVLGGGYGLDSVSCYQEIYRKLLPVLNRGEPVKIRIRDEIPGLAKAA